MATVTATTPTRTAPVTTVWRDLVVAVAGLWPVAGLYLDGRAHTHVAQLGTFFTPRHDHRGRAGRHRAGRGAQRLPILSRAAVGACRRGRRRRGRARGGETPAT